MKFFNKNKKAANALNKIWLNLCKQHK